MAGPFNPPEMTGSPGDTMREPRPITAFGYHGTNVEGAGAILRDGFRQSAAAFDWLGDGIYFWQDAPLRAWEWASQNKGFSEHAAVIGAEIELRNCVDLLDIGWHDALLDAYRLLADRYRRSERTLPRQSGLAHRLDRLVINYLVRRLGRRAILIRGVRGVFQEGGPVFPDSAIYSRSHVQIVVRDPALITYRWRVR